VHDAHGPTARGSGDRDADETFPIIRDLVTDVSFNFEMAKRVPALLPPRCPKAVPHFQQTSIAAGVPQCIECFHVPRRLHSSAIMKRNKVNYAGPRFFIRYAELEMHPLDTNDRRELLKEEMGPALAHHQVLYRVCPEHIHITDNAIIPAESVLVAPTRADRVVGNVRRPAPRIRRRSQRAARSLVRGGFSLDEWFQELNEFAGETPNRFLGT